MKRRRIHMTKDIHDHIEEALPELLFLLLPHLCLHILVFLPLYDVPLHCMT